MSKSEDYQAIFGLIVGVLIIVCFIASVIGYVNNIIILFSGNIGLQDITLVTILRVIGIFVAPLGGILGWL
jgi:hypothetical protein